MVVFGWRKCKSKRSNINSRVSPHAAQESGQFPEGKLMIFKPKRSSQSPGIRGGIGLGLGVD